MSFDLRDKCRELLYDLQRTTETEKRVRIVEAWYITCKQEEGAETVDFGKLVQRDTRCMVCMKAPCQCAVP